MGVIVIVYDWWIFEEFMRISVGGYDVEESEVWL